MYISRLIKLNKMKKEVFDKYALAIAEQFHLSLEQMFEKKRRRDCVDARQMLYYLCMERPIRISYIQRFMEENGHSVTHSTIIHGIAQVEKKIEEDSDIRTIIEELR